MEVDERPTEQYSDIGGLDTQIQEVYKVNNYNIYYNNIVYFTSFYSLRTEEDWVHTVVGKVPSLQPT